MREAVEVQAVVPVRAANERQLVRTEVLDDVVEANAEVLHQRHLAARLVVERHRLVEDGEVARLLEVSDGTEDEPHRVVVEAAADVVVAALGERLVLVVAPAVRELRGGDVDDALAGALGDLVDEADEVLVGVAEAHAAADAGLEERGGARHVEGDHALVLVPDVHHAVEAVVAGLHRIARKEVVPVLAQLREGPVHLGGGVELLEEGLGGLLVDDALLLPLLLLGQLDVAEREDEGLLLARLQRDVEGVGGDRTPTVGDGVARLAGEDDLGLVKAVVEADERLAVRVEPGDVRIDAVERVVVAALLVLGLVVDDGPLDLDLARGEVALEVLHVGRGVPEAPLEEGEELDLLGLLRGVLERELLNLGMRLQRHEQEDRGNESVLLAGDGRVAHAVAARIGVEGGLRRLPAGIPDRVAVLDVKVLAARVHRHVVVAVARDAAELRVLEEGVAACGVGDEREEVLVAEIVDPRPRGLRVGDHVFAVGVVKVSEFHGFQGLGCRD